MNFRYLHLGPLLNALYYGTRWRLKRLLGIPDKPSTDVLSSGMDTAIARYRRICNTLLEHLPDRNALNGSVVAEIGCGDCLAAADMMLGLGARHAYLVESIPMLPTDAHREALQPLVSDPNLPNQGEVFRGISTELDPERVTFHRGLLENARLPEPVDLLYSFDVLEHVEDLEGFFSYCGEITRPGGIMIHKFDLSGHGPFEDPMPPLDFQTLPTWLFELAFPKYNRAAGNTADEFFKAIERNHFRILRTAVIREAEPEYLQAIRPSLRSELRKRSDEIVRMLDLIVIAERI
jgi:SAM-dependent methyltransferase